MFNRTYQTHTVKIGNICIGGDNDVKLQSMTNTQTLDVDASVSQCIDIIEAGADLVRLSAKNAKDLEALLKIKTKLTEHGYDKAVIADIHFSASLAVKAAAVVDKVRINPGNFYERNSDNDEDYLINIKKNLQPLIEECKKHQTAIRIGTNHGSLSKRIIEKYGTSVEAMVEATMEFVRLFKDLDFKDLILSVKASNAIENIKATRLLAQKLKEESFSFPLHLGVTEAGLGITGRIKSAVGIGALLADGIGDTIRVSLTESPEKEIPVALAISKLFSLKDEHKIIVEKFKLLADSNNFKPANNFLALTENKNFVIIADKNNKYFPGLLPDCFTDEIENNYKTLVIREVSDLDKCKNEDEVLIIETQGADSIYNFKNILLSVSEKYKNPKIIWKRKFVDTEKDIQLRFAAELGSLISDGMLNVVQLDGKNNLVADAVKTALEVLQITGIRISHADFISCPSCNRTSFNIMEIAEEIRSKTHHLKGLTIAVMGCIVNGPGEMGSADYGIVGQAKDLLSIYYKGKVVEKNVAAISVSKRLIELIKENGDWKNED